MRRYWPGLVLLGSGSVSILWLASQGKLGWYVHPRYALFGIVMSGLAIVVLIASAAVLARTCGADPHVRAAADASGSTEPHSHATSETSNGAQLRESARPVRNKRIRAALRTAQIAAVSAAALVLLVVPPATLTAQSMSHRSDAGELRGSASGAQAAAVAAGSEGDGAELGIRELALLLRQQDSSLLTGRGATVAGFVLPDPDDPKNVFVVARYAITCCAVDAQPLGVPVLHPGWNAELDEGDWVEVSGVFTAHPSATSAWPAVLLPSGVTAIEEPEDPYVS